ncbi:NAD(P)/FAD-dependent oxidoreductase [Flavobacterium granuli]|uniref:Dehydrogenase (Flavoprotein) n=1 Tax=Flavobacterium granuli TaxID=280093 RepID=A0A1M5NP98_9FLAO|nr:NAD(P)/FAD-dependent oxidoreductase [Flavobacterium granuli]PRZ23352.1 flavin-dependent dehydrogenase [Flavobacterium granuli]SHG91307.1 Dehydrogenase (flavoprotein) [Flavobacterium granuli]
MKTKASVIIVGGGLAGLTAAIHLLKTGIEVILIEKNEFPKHKVCGEYISNEVSPYFKWLDIDIQELRPVSISKLHFSIENGQMINCKLPLGGFGVSRYTLDEFLYKKAITAGCQIIQDNVESVVFSENQFKVSTSNSGIFESEIVLGAFGKRSNIDQKLSRKFIHKKSPWLAVKAHYRFDFPDDVVGLHTFEGGYCGISKVENNRVNVCYLANYDTFKKYRNIDEYQQKVVSGNPHLKLIFQQGKMLFEKPLTISQISFEKKNAVENHILMIGDSAGLIHPLCGNGMAMAIHGAKIVSELIGDYFNAKIGSRSELEQRYNAVWNTNFEERLKTARFLTKILQRPKLTAFVMQLLVLFPFLLSVIIRKTHGKSIL